MVVKMRFLNRIWFWSNIISVIMLLTSYSLIDPEKEYPKSVRKTIYIDRKFSQEEKLHIIEAALEWSRVTNHIVEYEIESLPCPIKLNQALVITKYNPDHPDIITMDVLGQEILGYYVDGYIPAIFLVAERINKKDLTNVIMHELGHSLGLEHIDGEDDKNALMYPTMNPESGTITQKDLINFCKLYKCDPKKFTVTK